MCEIIAIFFLHNLFKIVFFLLAPKTNVLGAKSGKYWELLIVRMRFLAKFDEIAHYRAVNASFFNRLLLA